jgi:ribonuclease P protein component
MKKGWDYVLIGKKEVTASRDFIKLKNDLTYALQKIHK